MFSPHTRGCSHLGAPPHRPNPVFPAYAGMFRVTFLVFMGLDRFPRIRGDVPKGESLWLSIIKFSPHTRGCSCGLRGCGRGERVFPAYAGMFRSELRCCSVTSGFPRIRGDVPRHKKCMIKTYQFSPHTRGCSSRKAYNCWSVYVFPAYAGMFLTKGWILTGQGGFPRIRGDVPMLSDPTIVRRAFSPHTRGCSGVAATGRGVVVVFPAYAGMFRLTHR